MRLQTSACLLVRPRLLLLSRTGRALHGRSLTPELLASVGSIRVGGLRRRIDLGNTASPRVGTARSSTIVHRLWGLRLRRRAGASPLRTRRTNCTCSLISLWVNISGSWCLSGRGAVLSSTSQELQSALDVRVVGIQLGSTLVRVKGVGNLVVTRFIQSTQIIPDLRDERVEADGTRISIERISILVDLVVKHTDGTPEGGISPIAVYGLLVGFVCLRILLLLHIAPAEKIPALCIRVVGCHRFLQVLDGPVLTGKALALVVVQPAKLLENLGVVGIPLKDTVIGSLGIIKLEQGQYHWRVRRDRGETHVFLLLMYVSNLEPDVFLCQWSGRRGDDVSEALQ